MEGVSGYIMKRSELKKVLKPLIKECIKEVMFEDGVLSGLISEVAKGIGSTSAPPPRLKAAKVDPMVERMKRNAFSAEESGKLKEHKNKLMAAIGDGAYNGVNLFEGTTPTRAQQTPTQQSSPLANVAPDNAGVDISNLFGSVGNHWNVHMNEIKERK